MKKLLSVLSILLFFSYSLFASSGVVTSIEATKKNKETSFIKCYLDKSKNIQYQEQLYVDDFIEDNDILQTGKYTKATIKVDGLTITINRLSRIAVKYAIVREKELQALYELKKGSIDVSFDSSKYDTKKVAFDLTNGSQVVITGTKLTIYASGQVCIHEGHVSMYDKSHTDKPPREFGPGDFGEMRGPIQNRDFPPDKLSPKDPQKDHDRRSPPPKPDRQPAQASDMNKAPMPPDRNKN